MSDYRANDPRFHSWLSNRAAPEAPTGLLERITREAEGTPQQRWLSPRLPLLGFAVRVAAGAVVLAVVVGAGLLLSNLPRGVAGPTTSQTAAPSQPSESATTSSIPLSSTAPQPTPSLPSGWELRALATPPGHPDFVVQGVSQDGKVVLFTDNGVYDHLYVERDGQVKEISLPGHEAGTAVFSFLSPGHDFAVLEEANRLWRYDLVSGELKELPEPPGVDGVIGTEGIGAMAITSETSLALTTARMDVPRGETHLLTLNIAASTYTAIGNRTNIVAVFGTIRGLILIADESDARDNSAWHLYLVQSDGSDTLLYDASGSSFLDVSPDGHHLALSKGDTGTGGTWIVDLADNSIHEVSSEGAIKTFSPDGKQFSVFYQQDDHVEAFDLAGNRTAWFANGAVAGWVPVP